MNGSQSFMLYKGSIRSRRFATRFACCVFFLIAWIPLSFAQAPYADQQISSLAQAPPLPPLDVPINRLPAKDPNAIAIDGWLLYPTLRVYSLYSDNLFLTPQSPLSVPGVGITPSLAAVWSNGIHTTTLFGNIDRQVYPTANEVNTIDGRAGFSQKYEAMRDLIFTVNGNYVHQTWASSLQDSIPTAPAAPTTTVLPNGNTVLPNGTILSPSGQPIGQASAAGINVPLLVDPSNQYTGTFSVDKIFNRGVLNLTGSVNRTDYELQNLQSTRSRTLTESAGVWLGPVLYAYSNGSVGTVVTDAISASTTSYRVIGGLGTRQVGLFRGSFYFGHQGSGGSTTAGGEVYGGALSYYPTSTWTLTGAVDETVNIASQTSASNLALTLPTLTAVQVPLSTSSRITSAALQSNYQIAPLWSTVWQLGYTRIEFVDSSRLDNAWILDTILRYDIRRDIALTWEYRYRSILSNVPLVSATSNYASMGAAYKF
jgi:hypothetical protein